MGVKPAVSARSPFRRENENLTQAAFAVLAAPVAQAFLTFWPLRVSIFISTNISLGFIFFPFFCAIKCSGSCTVRDEALTCRENSFLEVSIKFHLSRAE